MDNGPLISDDKKLAETIMKKEWMMGAIKISTTSFQLHIINSPLLKCFCFFAAFIGKFIGSAKLAEMPQQMFVGGKLTGFYLEKLVAQCRAAIDRIDGPILQMAPRKVLRRPGAESAGNSVTQ